MDDTTPGPQTDNESHNDHESTSGMERGNLVRIAIWTVGMLALLGYLAVGQVSAVWYRYNAFLNRVYREDDSRGFVDIWQSWLEFLPGGTGLSIAFVASIGVVLLCTGWGAWLLLVSSGAPTRRSHAPVSR